MQLTLLGVTEAKVRQHSANWPVESSGMMQSLGTRLKAVTNVENVSPQDDTEDGGAYACSHLSTQHTFICYGPCRDRPRANLLHAKVSKCC